MFADLQSMSSDMLIRHMTEETVVDVCELQQRQQQEVFQSKTSFDKFVLVDVRTHEEQDVSMIPHAIHLQEFEALLDQIILRSNDNNNHMRVKGDGHHDEYLMDDIPPIFINVITYCTIGYRSGLQARYLRHKYNLHSDKIYNLDGIVSYTHAATKAATAAVAAVSKVYNLDGTVNEDASASTSLAASSTRIRQAKHEHGDDDNVARQATISSSAHTAVQLQSHNKGNGRGHNSTATSANRDGHSKLALVTAVARNGGANISQPPDNPFSLINPLTRDKTNEVHTFGTLWARSIDSAHFHAIHYHTGRFILESAKVGKLVVRNIVNDLCQCCTCRGGMHGASRARQNMEETQSIFIKHTSTQT
jgi:rhodanese-related sulfurtransferase